MYCRKCGKKIEDGEICSCSSTENQKNDPQTYLVKHQTAEQSTGVHTVTETDVLEQKIGEMPDTKALMDGLKSNPIVANVINAFKKGLLSPISFVESSTQRKDILWLILMAIESVVISLGCIMVCKRGILYILNFADDSSTLSFRDFNKGLKELGIETSLLFVNQFAWTVICIVCTAAVIALILAISGKKPTFSAIANTTAAIYVPATIMTAAAVVFSVVFFPLSLLLLAFGMISVVILGYEALTNHEKKSLVFWLYIVGIVIIAGISVFTGCHFIQNTAEEIYDSTVSEFLDYIL